MNNLQSLLHAARAEDAKGRLDAADRLCREILYVHPRCAEALLLAGSIAARRGKNDEAIDALRRAFASDPNSYDAARWLAGLLMSRGEGPEAVEFAQAAVRIKPKQFEAHALAGIALVSVGDNFEAIRSLKKALELNPKSPNAHHNLGVAYQRDGETAQAIDSFRRALALSPNLTASRLHLGKALLENEQHEAAIECFETAVKLNPNVQSAKALLADATFVAIHGVNGEPFLLRTLEEFPNESFPHALMGSWLQEQGRFEEAEISIQRSIDLKPKQGFAYYLAVNNRKMRQEDRPLLDRLETLSSDSEVRSAELRYIHFALGKAYDDLKEFEKAILNLDLANAAEGALEAEVPSKGEARSAQRAQVYREVFSRELFDRISDVGSESHMPIFIFGMPRSGTTLLEQIVSRHSKVGAAGEQIFWRDNRRRIVDLNRRTIDTTAVRGVATKYLELLQTMAPGKEFVTEKMPSNYIHLGLLHLAFPNATFVHAKRHPVDTSLSIYMRPFFTQKDHGHTRESIVNAYKTYQAQMEHWRTTLPAGRILEVQYEDMVSQPETMIRKVISHCGLDWEDACLSPEAGERRVKTFSKWQVRQPVYTTSVARWKNYEPWLGPFRELMPP